MKRLLLIALSATSLAYAQDKVVKKHVRFIALGELPPWADDLKNGVRVQRKSPEGAKPPSQLNYSQGDKIKSFDVRLRSVTEIASFPSNAGEMRLKKGAGVEGALFIKSPMPSAPLSLGVLFRDLKSMSWKNPQMLMLKDDASSFPVGQMRFVNVSDSTVLIKIAGLKPFGLAPGKVSMKPLKVGSTPIKVGYVPEGGGSKRIWQNKVNMDKSSRVQCFFFKAQGKKPQNAVKFHSFPESVPTLPKVRGK